MDERRFKKRSLFLALYLVFALLPVYWMVNMSFKTNNEILSVFSLWPRDFTLDHYRTILTDESWYSGYINSMIYVAINTVISLAVALPAASCGWSAARRRRVCRRGRNSAKTHRPRAARPAARSPC